MRCPLGLFACLALAFSVAVPAGAAEPEFGFNVGYGHLWLGGDMPGELERQSGGRVEPWFMWSPSQEVEQIRLGFGVGFSGYREETDTDDDDDDFFETDDFEQIGIINPEFLVSWRQPIADSRFFIEPGVGVGIAVGNYQVGEAFFGLQEEDIDRWRVGPAVRPFLRAGYRFDHWTIGLEAAYHYTYLDFDDDIGGDVQEFSATVFFSFVI